MNRDGKFPDYAEIWVNANRARDIHLALLFALDTAAFTETWKSLRQPSPLEKDSPPPGGRSTEDAGRKTATAVREAKAVLPEVSA
jgi:hypothetical protein